MGQLSPKKKSEPQLSPAKKVAFEKLGSLSPVKNATTAASSIDLGDLKARASRLRSGLAKVESDSRLTPQEVKSKLGTVTKLSDLQAKLKSLNEKSAAVTAASTSSHRRALFATPTARPSAQAPKLSQTPITLDIVKVKSAKPFCSWLSFELSRNDLKRPDSILFYFICQGNK